MKGQGLILGVAMLTSCGGSYNILNPVKVNLEGTITKDISCNSISNQIDNVVYYTICTNFSMTTNEKKEYYVSACRSFKPSYFYSWGKSTLLETFCLEIKVGDKISLTGDQQGTFIKTYNPITFSKKKDK